VTGPNRLENARAEIQAARDALAVSTAALSLGIHRDAMSRAYYAVFHAARALLLLEGVEPKTHAGVHRMVGEQLVRTQKLSPHEALTLTRLQAYRAESDYGYSFVIDAADAEKEIDAARTFVEHAAARVVAINPT